MKEKWTENKRKKERCQDNVKQFASEYEHKNGKWKANNEHHYIWVKIDDKKFKFKQIM